MKLRDLAHRLDYPPPPAMARPLAETSLARISSTERNVGDRACAEELDRCRLEDTPAKLFLRYAKDAPGASARRSDSIRS
ncbi:hypothetical protein DOTSEDRAFT_73335 [Dothistroma septosporum NZE10]|uniref:Uncharacterized protein n=1 Tax=Dothistroma septosporum (strain NZE10 / CBS 128990) TaxID=675120 RepID=N1PIN0_DOTSN|nr:hypothetical protein DOTSEDRAFT_73335 [Dothistroma septosporum NZE10]